MYIYSTLSCNQLYTKYAPAPEGGVSRVDKTVLINGGANVANKNIITPRGVVTEISEEEYNLIKDNALFKTHIDNGYITVEAKSADVDKVVVNMESRSQDAPLTPQDYEVEGKHETAKTTIKAKNRK
jgi:rRNA maturation endonuclease Nob1